MNRRLAQSCAILCFVMTAALVAQQPQPNGPEIVGKQTFVLTQPPTHVPSGTVADGAFLGNGDVGVVLAGAPDQLQFYIGKNDFWSQQASPMTVGGVELKIPALKGASFHEEEDLLNAEVRGKFATPAAQVTTTSWVAAKQNLFITALESTGSAKVTVDASIFPQKPVIVNNDKHVNIGRAQSGVGGEPLGQGHGYFDGVIDEVHIYDRALAQPDAAQLMDLKSPTQGLVRRWGFDALEGTTPMDTPTKIVRGQDCPTPPPVYRPDEQPTDQPTGCIPEGYHLDYQRYAAGKIGRGIKVTHSWEYIDAGDAPQVHEVSVAAWIYIYSAGDANYIVSKGDWNDAYSLCLDHGRLRFNIGNAFVRSEDALPTHQWLHVVGTFDGVRLKAYVNAQQVLPEARYIASGNTSDTIWMSRNADGPLDEQAPWPNPLPPTTSLTVKGREVSVAVHVIGAPSTAQNGTLSFSLQPGAKVYLVVPILSDLDDPNHLAAAQALAAAQTSAGIEADQKTSREWWRNYWSESSVETGDPVLDKYYYSAQYEIATASRTGKIAPGLYGPWVTTDHPAWNGDYTLDYNHQTPYLALYSSNHAATSDPYDPPILKLMDRSREYARTLLNERGVYYPGHMGPWGIERPFDYDPFMGMKSNAGFLAMPMLMRFYSTYDDTYAHEVYPFLKAVGEFWQDDLVKENGQYVIHNDCSNEVGPWLDRPAWATCVSDTNPTNDLGFVEATFKGLIDISKELGVDASERPAWQEILDHMSPYPTGVHNGKTVFLAARVNEGSKETSTIPSWGNLAIWPGNQIGLGADGKLAEIGLNTISVRGYSSQPLMAPAMARVGYDPQKLIAAMKADALKNAYPNGYLYFRGGGVETSSQIPGAVNEMMLQSFSGTLHLFPDWPKGQNASFENLRAYGAFLVSAKLQQGRVEGLTITSEKGKDCRLANPWAGKSLVVTRNGQKAETVQGDTVTFKTAMNETITVQPAE
jgi:alpha-L-fucosidase 2